MLAENGLNVFIIPCCLIGYADITKHFIDELGSILQILNLYYN